jgi:hypothetical protein
MNRSRVAYFPSGVLVYFPSGAPNLHLLVCYLERQGVSRVLGELKAKQVVEFWATDHYTWVYRQVLDRGSDIAAILKARQLLPAR